MTWSNVKLILGREIRDQLRDRRTLFMIAVLPILLYPLMGISFFQIAQFMGEHPTRVLIVGGADVSGGAGSPALFQNNQFNPKWFSDETKSRLLELTFSPADAPPSASANDAAGEDALTRARRAVQQGGFEAAVYFPPDFARRLAELRDYLKERKSRGASDRPPVAIPSPQIHYNTARETSQVAHQRLEAVLQRWQAAIGEKYLEESDVPLVAARPFKLDAQDVSESPHRDAAIWSKLLPFVVVIWALTGAFYPAIDLCAGEKERGTLETLLSSPAQRSEIVVGKLLTIMLFSVATAVLNLASMGLTGGLVMSKIQSFSPNAAFSFPPPLTVVWLLAALLPMAALFSALSLALAAFARSSKEGQYYLMPLILVSLPLMILPMAPTVELTLGYSLIPITGVLLLLRELLQGNYELAAMYVAPVLGVTFAGCFLAVRWAIDQFNSETVLFRESERLDLGLWIRHVVRDRQETPTVAAAVFCGFVILLVRFFSSLAIPSQPGTAEELLRLQATSMLAVILAPTLIMAVMLTRSPRKSLLLTRPPLVSVPLAALLAAALHPVAIALVEQIARLYPSTAGSFRELEQMLAEASLGPLLLVFALLPAICEELTFRGFILSGLRRSGHKWRAIVGSSLFFGVTHLLFQQSITAFVMGVVIGFIAVQTGSIFPCMLYHATHNALTFCLSRATPAAVESNPLLGAVLMRNEAGQYVYEPWALAAGAVAAIGLLAFLARLPYRKTPEETLQEAIRRHAARSPVG